MRSIRIARTILALTVLVAVACEHDTPPSSPVAPTRASDAASSPAPSPGPRARLPGRVVFNTKAGDLWTMKGNGTHRRLIADGSQPYFDPSWSPDGSAIVFRIDEQGELRDPYSLGLDRLAVVPSDGGALRYLQPSSGGLFPDWSPDGRWILYSGVDGPQDSSDSIYVVNAVGSHPRRLSDKMGECGEWSRDGQRIAFCSHDGDGDFEVWVMRADGSDAVQLTRASGISQGAVWSPDGSELAFSSTRGGDGELFVMDRNGGSQQRVIAMPDTYESPVAWLPQGIVFASFREDAALPTWLLVRPDGTGLRSLPWLRGAAAPLDWLLSRSR